nr:hypothetical protein [Streptomyces paludis]
MRRETPGTEVAALLIRPDGYVAWASPTPDPAGLPEALDRWCGNPLGQ